MLTEKTFEEMNTIMGNCANIRPAYTFNQDTPAQLPESQVVSNDARSERSTSVDATDLEGEQRGKKRRRHRPDAMDVVKELLEVFKNKWKDDKETAVSIHEDEKDEKASILKVMKTNQESMNSVIDVLRTIAEKM
jgi:hypothetical protein